jgi:hexosaminidase
MIAMMNSATNRFINRITTITDINDKNIQAINKIEIHLTKNSSSLGHLSPYYNTSSYNTHVSNEEYLIAINSYEIKVFTPSVKGVLLALTSLVQILNSPNRLYLSPYFILHDWPHNNWRGMLVDVARHYQPVELLKRTINAMEVSKYNVLHLHLTDSQSFPILLEDTNELKLSHLSLNGSFSSQQNNGFNKVYTTSDLRELVDYAKIRYLLTYSLTYLLTYSLTYLLIHSRGIEIIPEIDVPAHTLSWSKSAYFQSIVTKCSNTALNKEHPDDIFVMNITNPLALAVVKGVIKTISGIFPSKFIHIGGDEIEFDCWKEVAANENYEQLLHDFEQQLFNYIHKDLNKVPMVWQGVLDSHSIPLNDSYQTVIQPWKCWSGLAVRSAKIAHDHNLSVVMSSCWYLDWDNDWLDYLTSDDIIKAKAATYSRDRKLKHIPSQAILGGEASIWTEHVDCTNFECRVWPRAGSIASRLWGLPAQLQPTLSNTHAITIPKESLVYLLGNLVFYRSFLYNIVGIKASSLMFHLPNGSTLIPKAVDDQATALSMIKDLVKRNMTLSPQKTITYGVQITSSCLGIPQAVQRPYITNTVLIAQLNIADGGGDVRSASTMKWLQEKASVGYLAIGLCELNGWERVNSNTNYDKNIPKMVVNAAAAGFVYSHLMVNSQPYNIGIVSAIPFSVRGEYGPPLFQRGVLHVYYDTLDLHVIICHLHAHDSELREAEAKSIVSKIIKPLQQVDKDVKIVLMGDLNTLSSYDRMQHIEINFVDNIQRSDDPVFARYRKKYLNKNNTINYSPMDTLLSSGLSDVCIEHCNAKYNIKGGVNWSLKSSGSNPLSTCMAARCPFTEPTRYNPEWPQDLSPPYAHPAIRLDYILVSKSVVEAMNDNYVTGIEINNQTDYISDHYPVHVEWYNASYVKFY